MINDYVLKIIYSSILNKCYQQLLLLTIWWSFKCFKNRTHRLLLPIPPLNGKICLLWSMHHILKCQSGFKCQLPYTYFTLSMSTVDSGVIFKKAVQRKVQQTLYSFFEMYLQGLLLTWQLLETGKTKPVCRRSFTIILLNFLCRYYWYMAWAGQAPPLGCSNSADLPSETKHPGQIRP